MFWRDRRGRRGDDLVTATEVASWVYCPEQWRLQYGLGLRAENQGALETGTRHHAGRAVAERLAGWSIRLGQLLIVAALLVLLLWAFFR